MVYGQPSVVRIGTPGVGMGVLAEPRRADHGPHSPGSPRINVRDIALARLRNGGHAARRRRNNPPFERTVEAECLIRCRAWRLCCRGNKLLLLAAVLSDAYLQKGKHEDSYCSRGGGGTGPGRMSIESERAMVAGIAKNLARYAAAGGGVWQIAVPSGSRVDLGMTPIVNQQVMVMTKYHGSFTDATSCKTRCLL